MVEKVNAGDGRLPTSVCFRSEKPPSREAPDAPPLQRITLPVCPRPHGWSASSGCTSSLKTLPVQDLLPDSPQPPLPPPSMPRFALLQCTKLQSAQDGRTADVQSCGSWGLISSSQPSGKAVRWSSRVFGRRY